MHGAVLAEVALPNSADAARKKSLLFYLVSFESILDLNIAQSQSESNATDGGNAIHETDASQPSPEN